MNKRCKDCGLVLPTSSFYKNRAKCKKCYNHKGGKKEGPENAARSSFPIDIFGKVVAVSTAVAGQIKIESSLSPAEEYIDRVSKFLACFNRLSFEAYASILVENKQKDVVPGCGEFLPDSSQEEDDPYKDVEADD